jgi:hypothetical protein
VQLFADRFHSLQKRFHKYKHACFHTTQTLLLQTLLLLLQEASDAAVSRRELLGSTEFFLKREDGIGFLRPTNILDIFIDFLRRTCDYAVFNQCVVIADFGCLRTGR